ETKNLHLLIETAEILKSKNFNFNIKIAGAPILESDKKYFEKLKEKIKEKELDGIIEFVGPIPNKDIAEFYQSGDLFANLSDTGSMDKTVLEAMVSGTQILVSNEAFADILPNENKTTKDPEQIVKDIMEITKIKPSPFMRDYVFSKHNLANLISAIVKTY
ncbi:MAG: glycosyltransferase, partial [Patescibacteria group bacterium]